MLQYTKKILTKVSFDKKLFRKELIKAKKLLKTADDRQKLMVWALATFGAKYGDVITDVFS
ncbi:MAG: hypothetical protein HKO56_05785 [Bacteroidia bacterium]|nr:hypothetical protein [Bacteroidia bacterium]NNM16151.1 hypothetical protein [Bacteroidia bacterium]